ncbi:MAG: lycopene cyclase domain-containing protein [Lacibacter sp.]|jgi:lycopene cyclase domain-containing protein
MNSQYTYFLIHLCSLAGPLLLSFDRKVAFYKKWKFVFPAMLIPAMIFLVWDEYFTRIGVWSFNESYITGMKIGHLPIEEVLFFVTVPYCCLFVYECLRVYFPRIIAIKNISLVYFLLGFVALIPGFWHFDKAYTSYTFILNAAFIACVFLFRNYFSAFDPSSFLISFLVCLIPFFIVNGFLTAIPVVLYNDAENLGIRLFSFFPSPMHNIPFEDTFYGMLLIAMNVAFYERFRMRNRFVESKN